MKLFLVTVLILGSITIVPPGATAGDGVVITKIRFNRKGPDDGSKESLNNEIIKLRNDSDRAIGIRGWKIHDAGRDNVYKIKYRVRLKPGDRLWLYTGRGTDLTGDCSDSDCPTTHYWHWDKTHYVWDNDGDTATLLRRDGSVADRCHYLKKDDSPKICS